MVEAGLFKWKAKPKTKQNSREITHHWRQAITPEETLRAGPGLGDDEAPDASGSPRGAAGLGGSTVSTSAKGEVRGG